MNRPQGFGAWYMAAVARGFSQVLLQENIFTGILFLAGITLAVPLHGACALAACFLATGLALALGYEKDAVCQGLFSYNAVLIGIAVPFFLPLSLPALLLLVFGALASVPVTVRLGRICSRFFLPALTAPFILVTWTILLIAKAVPQPFQSPLFTAVSLLPYAEWPLPLLEPGTASEWGAMVFKGLGEIMFQGTMLTGIFFLAGLAAASRRSALLGAIGGLLGGLLGFLLGAPESAVFGGIYGYNATLCTITMAVFLPGFRQQAVFAVAGVMLSCFILLGAALAAPGLPMLTAPFVLASWICLWAHRRLYALPA